MGKQKEELDITIKDLLAAGAHFGHQKMRWNPKMKRYIFEERSGIYIIDLAKTMQQIRNALEVVRDVVTQHKTIMFVGTKKQAKVTIRECAENADEFYVNERWLGGMLTNLTTIRKSIKTLEKVEKRISTGGEGLTKKELSNLTKEQLKLDKNLSGIRTMRKPPGLLIVVDPYQEHIAVAEAKKLNIPVMALVDTNCNPDPIDHVIACNDDALKSVKLILTTLTNAIIEKKKEMKVIKKGEKKPTLKTNINEDIEIDVSDTETDKEV
ncbi:MAG: 30S ribosomal protein S2 [Candidatus Anoxychlamydiales bacterium]|nr:30S ribosomal protein S2 [Candidatus Anoxychlamydiales bacterium]